MLTRTIKLCRGRPYFVVILLIVLVLSFSEACSDKNEEKTITISGKNIEFSRDNVNINLSVQEYEGDHLNCYSGTVIVPEENRYLFNIGDTWCNYYLQPDYSMEDYESGISSAVQYKDVIESWDYIPVNDTPMPIDDLVELMPYDISNRHFYRIAGFMQIPSIWGPETGATESIENIRRYALRYDVDSYPIQSAPLWSSPIKLLSDGSEYYVVPGQNRTISLLNEDVLFVMDAHEYTLLSEFDQIPFSEISDIGDHLENIVEWCNNDSNHLRGDYCFFNAEIVYYPLFVDEYNFFPGRYDIYLIPVWSIDYAYLTNDESADNSFIGTICMDLRTGEIISLYS